MTTKNAILKLIYIMKKKGITTKQLASQLKKPKQYIYELRRRERISIDELNEIASALDVEIKIKIKEK